MMVGRRKQVETIEIANLGQSGITGPTITCCAMTKEPLGEAVAAQSCSLL